MSKRKGSKVTSLPVVEANAAAADIGATQIFVGAPPDRDTEPIRCFDTFTADLERLADWLEQCQIRTVAMNRPACIGFRRNTTRPFSKIWSVFRTKKNQTPSPGP